MAERTVAEVHEAIKDLLPTLRARAQETEDLRNVPEDLMKALQETGHFAMLQPKRYGGLEASPVDFHRNVRLVAGACGSTAWLASVLGVHPWQLALFPDQAQEDVWGEDNTTLISSSYAPMGRATAVDGGYLLSGKWSFSSGCDHARWVFLGGLIMDGENVVDFRTFLVPREDYEIVDVWDTVGLRGTGSNDIIVYEAFVPEHRTLSFVDTGRCVAPGQASNTAPIYRLPFASLFSSAIANPILGMANGALEEYLGWTRDRVRASTGAKASGDSFNQLRIAEAATLVDAATLALERSLTEELELAIAGQKIPMELRVRVRRDQVAATLAGVKAIDRLFESAGGRALKTGTPIQRFWRDAHSGRVHAINDPEKAQVLFGQHALGLKIQDAWV
jgi:3-hydroxy-9,10-secoandrosta-1,3,5(10)-triene-9,17-dione monooxygenase